MAHKEFENNVKEYNERIAKLGMMNKQEQQKQPKVPKPSLQENFTVTDATIEGVLQKLADQPWGMFYCPDELIVLLGSLDGYRQSGAKKDMGIYNSLFYNKPLYTIRADEKRESRNPSPFVGIMGNIPPEKMKQYALYNKDFFSTGFASRCLMVYPPEKTIDVCDFKEMESDKTYDFIIDYLWLQRKHYKRLLGTDAEIISPDKPVIFSLDADAMLGDRRLLTNSRLDL